MQLQNWRKSAAFVLLFVLILPILAACGGTAPAATDPAPTTAAAEPTAAPAGEATAAPTEAAAAEPTAEATEAPAAEPTAEATGDTGSAVPGILRMNIGADPDNWDPQRA